MRIDSFLRHVRAATLVSLAGLAACTSTAPPPSAAGGSPAIAIRSMDDWLAWLEIQHVRLTAVEGRTREDPEVRDLEREIVVFAERLAERERQSLVAAQAQLRSEGVGSQHAHMKALDDRIAAVDGRLDEYRTRYAAR